MDPFVQVLAVFPAVFRSATIVPLGNRGGFSGARLWRLETMAGAFCLRAGAPTETRAHLQQRHALMARARTAGLMFVPAVLPAEGGTVVEASGRCWEMMEWLPGQADFHTVPTSARLRAAASALAQLHRAWQGQAASFGPPPAIARRLEATRLVLPDAPALPRHPLLDPLRERIRRSLARRLPEVLDLLREWEGFCCPLQPCLRDVWHDHLLFEGDILTGLVDYAGAGPDGVAADLARMLGSLVGDDEDRWRDALEAYRAHRPLSGDEERLAHVLDRTGVIAGLCNWLRWLHEPRPTGADFAGAVHRVEELVTRAEAW
jgi:Ser/Thr protein kinase RdoA (MazF antagonist)